MRIYKWPNLLHSLSPIECSITINHHYALLKTLFIIAEAPFNFFFLLWSLCRVMMFRWTNKQPGIQTFWNLCGHYQDIYDWISPLNKWSNTAVYGEKLVRCIWSLVYFLFFEALNGAFEVQFLSGLHFYTVWKTLIVCRDMQLRFFKVKTLLNNAFKCGIQS